MFGTNTFIYIAILAGALFTLFNLYSLRKLPLLAELFSLMLSAAAACSGVELCISVLEGTKKLGDFQDQKLTIVLGSIAVFWVSLLTAVNLVKGVAARAALQGRQEVVPVQENA